MFDWTKISKDPCCPKVCKLWEDFYNKKIVRFNLFETLNREQYIINLCCQDIGHVKLLDIGFAEHTLKYVESDSWFHRKLRKLENHTIFGLDINKDLVNDISILTGFNNLHVGSACDNKLIIDNGNFDVIHAGDIIEHVGNLSDFFLFCSNNLKPNGRIVLTTPNPCAENVIKSFKKNSSIRANMEHTCWVTPSNINELCRRNGFNFSESHYVMNKKRTIKNIFREKFIFAKKDIYFGEFLFVLSKQVV
jgi:2-polyprenyl-3-methyl-5-hydroxy-6-metoxy-1,4-benzoquinol methylase